MIRYLNSKEWSPIVLRMFPVMVFSSALAMLLLIVRMERSSSFAFVFLAWNLFLAWIPFAVSLAFRKEISLKWWARGGLFILWLLFFPECSIHTYGLYPPEAARGHTALV